MRHLAVHYGLPLTCALLAGITPLCVPAQDPDPAMDAYYAANALYNKKLYDLAAQDYKAFMANYPTHPKFLHVRLGLALSIYGQKRYAEAERHFAALAAIREAPEQEQIHNLWGQCLLMLNEPEKAEYAFLWSVKRGRERFFLELPGIADVHHESPQVSVATITELAPLELSLAGLIEALFQQRKWNEVITWTDELVKLVPNGRYSLRARFQNALARYELKQYETAAGILKELVREAPDSEFGEHAVFLLAECYRELGNLEGAAVNHEIVGRRMQGVFAPDALYRLGYVRFMQKRYADAAGVFREFRSNYGKNPQAGAAGMYLGRSLLEEGDYLDAQVTFEALAKEPATAAEATLWLGKTYMRQEKYARAVAVLEPAVKKFKDDPLLSDLLFDRGNALMGQERFKEAALSFARVYREFAESAQAADALRLEAFCLHRDGDYEASLKQCDAFLAKHAGDEEAEAVSFLRAENLFMIGMLDDAIAAYKPFIPWRGETKNTDAAKYRTGQALYKQRKWAAALKELIPLIMKEVKGPLYAQISYLAGDSFFNQKKWDTAAVYFERFLAEQPRAENTDAALLKLALSYDRLGKQHKAMETLATLLRSQPKSEHTAHALAELGRLQYDAGKLQSAGETLQRIVDEFPATRFRPHAEYYLGWVAAAQMKDTAAVKHFLFVVNHDPRHELAADALYQACVVLLRGNAYGEAEKALAKFADLYADDKRWEEVLFYTGVSHARQRHWDKALEYFGKIINDFPDSKFRHRAYYELAWCEKESGKPEDAQARYAMLLREYPETDLTESAILEWAELEFEANKYAAAAKHLTDLLARTTDGTLRERGLYRLGWCQLKMDQMERGAESFETMLRETDTPDSDLAALASYQAGEARLALVENEAAYRHFLRAANSRGGDEIRARAMLRLGETEALTGRWKESEETFASFLRRYKDSEYTRRAQFGLGWARENRKKFRDAVKAYELVLTPPEKDELGAQSQFQIGECLFALKDWDRAIKAFIKVEANYDFPTWSSKALLEIGQALQQRGSPKRAIERYEEVVKKYPDSGAAAVAWDLLKSLGAR